jgi:hypothetical protein
MKEEPYRPDALKDLGHENAQRMEAEQLNADYLKPYRNRGLVNGDEPGRVKGVVKEVMPVHRHAPYRGGIILGTPPILIQAPQAEH